MDLGLISPAEFAVILGALSLAGFIKGAIGLGIPIVSVPVLAAVVGLPNAVALMVAPLLFTNLTQIWEFREERHRTGLMVPMLGFAVIGIGIGTSLLIRIDERYLSAVLGLFISVYALTFWLRPDTRLSERTGRRAAPFAGFASGVLQGMIGISAPVSLVFLHAMRWPRARFIFAISVMFLVFGITQTVSLSVAGLMTLQLFAYSCATLIPIMTFLFVGARVGKMFSSKTFERIVLWLLVLLALRLMWVAFVG